MSEEPGFSLLDDPWVIVRYSGGEVKEVSLRTALHDAQNIEQILGEVASQTVAILRLMLAIALCSQRWVNEDGSVNSLTIDRWRELWDEPEALIEDMLEYLADYEAEFDLFDPERPFMQVADLHTAKNEFSAVAKIVADIPDGEQFFTLRRGESAQTLNFAEAARWLVHVHAFDTSGIKSGAVGDARVKGGKGYPIGTGWVGQLGVIIVEGRNLIETILLNLVADEFYPVNGLDSPDPARDLPPWEREVSTAAVRGVSLNETVDAQYEPKVMGPVDLLTWQARRVRLNPQGEQVTGVVLAQGDKISPQDRWDMETMSAWRYSKPQSQKFKHDVYMPKLHYPEQLSWQGLPSIIAQLSGKVESRSKEEVPQFKAATVVNWVGYLLERGYLPDRGLLPVYIVGVAYGSQAASFETLVEDRLLLPAKIMEAGLNQSHVALQAAFSATDEVVRAVAQLAVNLAEAAGAKADTEARRQIRAKVSQRCYFELDEKFRIWLSDLDEDLSGSRKKWKETLVQFSSSRERELVANAAPRAFSGCDSIDLERASVFFWISVNKAVQELYQERNNHE